MAAGPALVCDALHPFASHLFTSRPWRLGASGHAGQAAGWEEASRIVGRPIVRLAQVHGAAVAVHRAGDPVPGPDLPGPEADIVVGHDAGAALAVRVADCVPLLLADRRTGAAAAAHAGWRGLAASVPAAAVDALVREFGCRPGDLLAAVGPAIGPCCYEVGPEVRERFADVWPAPVLDAWFLRQPRPTDVNPSFGGLGAHRPDRWYFDGARATVDQLERAGVPRDQVFDAGLCTASHPALFCSYRRDGGGAGRLAAIISPTPAGGSRARS